MATIKICYTDSQGNRVCTPDTTVARMTTSDSTAKEQGGKKAPKTEAFVEIVEELAKVVRKAGKDEMAAEPEVIEIFYRA